MSAQDIERLKSDASGNTALSEVLAEAIPSFSTTDDAINFLESRGFEITAVELARAASDEARNEIPVGEGEGGYGALMRFVVEH
ncbi:hypothetical protein [Aquabacter spiritensis]|uniref:Uncharacterized protein n=1 Tax=Aquabacter spiritensis TaxID=933073 RepID=A0A4R3M897_9HYPH|nr:hypothetical protein [Aquabacter spiritensis]TCT07565.1 hypothetical protein EDC64_10183 [Aquabacter spiritensis]